jgi:hypothetical protein
MEMPTKKEESESITLETDVFKFFAMLGNAGKYISMDKGPMDVSSPKISIKKNGDLSLEVFIAQR